MEKTEAPKFRKRGWAATQSRHNFSDGEFLYAAALADRKQTNEARRIKRQHGPVKVLWKDGKPVA